MEPESKQLNVLMGFYFYPRGGSAHACAALAAELTRAGQPVTLVAGSRSDGDPLAIATRFFGHCDVFPVDFTRALRASDPARTDPGPGSAPMHASYEDRPDAEDPVFAKLDDETFELHVRAWQRELERGGREGADVLYLHHLTPINEAAARAFPDTPIIGHIHGSELLMLEAIQSGPPPAWPYANRWAERMRDWASSCELLIVNSAQGLERAARLLDVERERFAVIPNGFSDDFTPRPIDRAAHWRRHLVRAPRGWAPGEPPGSVRYQEEDLGALRGVTLLTVGRFTAVKRLRLLIETYARARERFQEPTALVLVGGYPGEWEDEHPLETIRRVGADDVFLAGWHEQTALPEFLNASDVLVHPSANEQFGQVLVEAMACAVPTIAVNRGGPAQIVADGETGWLIPPDDPHALEVALVQAVNDRARREQLGLNARREALASYGWSQIAARTGRLIAEVARSRAGTPSSLQGV